MSAVGQGSCSVTYGHRVDVDWCGEVVDQIQTHWRERLRPRLDGLTDEEFYWQPVPGCWTISRHGESAAPESLGSGEYRLDYARPAPRPEPVTTIAWRLGHMVAGLAGINGEHFGGPPTRDSTFSYPGTADDALRQLDDHYSHWICGLRELGTAGLSEPQGYPPAFADAPVARKMLYVNVELIHHGAEVRLLRDLYLRESGERA